MPTCKTKLDHGPSLPSLKARQNKVECREILSWMQVFWKESVGRQDIPFLAWLNDYRCRLSLTSTKVVLSCWVESWGVARHVHRGEGRLKQLRLCDLLFLIRQ